MAAGKEQTEPPTLRGQDTVWLQDSFFFLLKVKSCAEFVSGSQLRIQEYEKQLEKTRNIIPFDQMTIDDLNEIFPETKLDKKYPYWPHQPIENL